MTNDPGVSPVIRRLHPRLDAGRRELKYFGSDPRRDCCHPVPSRGGDQTMTQRPGGSARSRGPPGMARLEPPQDPASARCTETAGRSGHSQVGPFSCLWAGREINIITILKR